MRVKDIQKILLQDLLETGGSAAQAVKELKATAEMTLDALELGNTPLAQERLEHGFTALLMAFHYLNIDLENVISREKARKANNEPGQEKAILIFGDHAELRVDGELRGTIPLYSEEDYQELRQIALMFGCRMTYADHVQLDIFSSLAKSHAS